MNLSGIIHLNKRGICLIFGILLIFFIYLTTNKTATVNKINLKNLLQVSIKAALNGGYEVIGNRNNLNIKSKGLTKEGLKDSVTSADFSSHCAMMYVLKTSFPSLNVISEETKSDCNIKPESSLIDVPELKNIDEWVDSNDITVWIDPLDATHEYTEKLYDYVTTMVCVSVKGQPLIGVIHKPFANKTSWAWVNKAKSPDLNIVNYNKNKVKIIISRSHSGHVKDILSKSFNDYELVIAAGAGYKALEVAVGNVDAYIHTTAIKKWDICAGNAIINAVGGKMTTKSNEFINYKESDPINEKGLIATLKNHEMFINKLN